MREQTKVFQNKLDKLASNNKAPDHKLIIDSNNKDNLTSQPQSSRQPTFIAINRFISTSKSQTLFSTMGTTIKFGKNKKYPDVPLLYGNAEDRKKWEGWQLHLKLKFCQSAILYICE